MIENYVNKLIENLPNESKQLQCLDVVLDGGAFNGSYLVGALYFLKEMERRKYVKIERISGCSIGSLCALLYLIDALDAMPALYEIIQTDFHKHLSLHQITLLKSHLQDKLPDNICEMLNGRLFVCYNNIATHKKVIKSTYKNVDDVIESIIKSCYVPFLIDNKLAYKKKYIDGFNAYIFKSESTKKILHMELFGCDKIMNALNIKNEKSNFHRILSGMLDIHSFYIKKSNTSMCSYVDNWNIINKCHYNTKLVLEYIIVYCVRLICVVKTYLPKEYKKHIFIQLLSKISFDIYKVLLRSYCL